MRPRINSGRLVSSTNSYRYMLSRRLIVEVIYNSKHRILSEKILDVRTSLQQ
jgi:hypothetical protein